MENYSVELFKQYFKGRTDDFAEQTQNGYVRVGRALSDGDLYRHFKGDKSCGIYLIDPRENLCWLTVIDIDTLDITFIEKIRNAALYLGLEQNQILPEFSGNKGYHSWFFYEETISADKARRLGQIIVTQAEIGRDIEVFPKQDKVAEDGFGSLVKLPLGVHKKSGQRSYLLDNGFKPVPVWEDYLPTIKKISKEQVDIILKEFDYILPKPVVIQASSDTRSLPCFKRIMEFGVSEGQRDNISFRLAIYLKKQGLTSDLVLSALKDWNKKNNPPLEDWVVVDKVKSVFEHDYSGYGCEQEYMKEFCSPECPIKRKEAQEANISTRIITLAELKETFKKYLYFEDYNVIDVVFGAIIKNREEGDPVWLFIVDVPSSGKTEVLRAFQGCEGILLVSSLTAQSLASGKTNPKTFGTEKDPSLFAQIDGKTLIVKDFTTVLSLRGEDQNKIFSQMRDSYDGFFDAKYGMEGGVFRYKTHYGFIAGVTLSIDRAYSLNNTMGERCLKYRINNNREKAQAKARENRPIIEKIRKELNEKTRQFLLGFKDPGRVTWPAEAEDLVEAVADVITRFRTPVNRDWRDFEVIEVIPEPEMPMRFANSLKNLGDGIAKVRGKTKISSEELRIIIKCAFDCLPKKILKIINALYSLGVPAKHSEIASATGLNTETVTRTCQDLFAIEVTEMTKSGEVDNSPFQSVLKNDIKKRLDYIFSKSEGSDMGRHT